MGKKQPRKAKHVPQRTCVVCRQKFDKRRLTRIVRTPDEGVVVDPSGKRNGRGAYLCDNPDCWEKAVNEPRHLSGALKSEVTAEERAAIAAHSPSGAHSPLPAPRASS